MNLTKLVEMMKTVTREKNLAEASHASRYSYAKRSMKTKLHKPDKTSQLAEDDDEKENKKSGRTDTGQKANAIITEPEFNSQVEPTRGAPPAKPQINTK